VANLRSTPTQRNQMDSARRTALVAGVFYLVTFVSIPTLILYGPVLEADYITSTGTNRGALVGCLLEVIVALAGIGAAITLFPVLKRQNEALALGFVASRTLEAAMLFTGVASIRSLIQLRERVGGGTGADSASLMAVGASHVATYDWAFTLGGSIMPGLNAILLGTLLYRSGLVPRILPSLGLIGAPIHLTAVALTLFGVIDRVSSVALVAAIPVAVWELSLGIYLVVKGFKPSALVAIGVPPVPPAPLTVAPHEALPVA